MTNIEDTEVPTNEHGASQDMNTDADPAPEPSDLYVWDHFKLEDSGANDSVLYCNYCGTAFVHPAENDKMVTHLTHECKGYLYPFEYEEEESGDESDGIFSQRQGRRALAKWIIMDGLPFTMVKREGFNYFVTVTQPKFAMPSIFEIAKDCYQIYLNEKEKMKTIVKETDKRVCLSIDTWTTVYDFTYIRLTAHFIDNNWNLKRKVLNFRQVPDLSGKTICKEVENCLHEWGIHKILTITMDRAYQNDSDMAMLSKKFNNWSAGILNFKIMHPRCLACMVNLVVKESLEDISESINKIRNAVKYVKTHSISKKFKDCVKEENIYCKSSLYMDTPGKWNTTYKMLDRAEKLQKAFERLSEEDDEYKVAFDEQEMVGPPTCEDWDNARIHVKILKIFYDLMLNIYNSLSVKSNLYFGDLCFVERSLNNWCKSEDLLLSAIAENIKRKYDKYCGSMKNNANGLMLVAAVLDPRLKLKFVEFCLRALYESGIAEEMTRSVKETLVQLFELYCRLESGTRGKVNDVLKATHEVAEQEEDPILELISLYKKHLMVKDSIDGKGELDKYLEDSCEDPLDRNLDILAWWKSNSSKYYILSQIAQDVLAMPICSLSPESAFNVGGPMLDGYRSLLPPRILEGLFCAQNWLRDPSILRELEEPSDDELETLETELWDTTMDSEPECFE
ncbi:zinc finger BED domain-containing protein RICESLEEPER 2-like [Senna tora]|uniref:Zinc finger BED domain-containing protein RICESLEEPER 2-like n=1 Tax=Senna tora TaxID=362788 RepID=A0A834TIC2_9FABA|nr:zinc finger BED domain-containing protein RICESLEEPER 2-like [Senna tora]